MAFLNKILPEYIFYTLRKFMRIRKFHNIEKLSLNQKFKEIYKEKIWNPKGELGDFYSGTGSHDAAIVLPYVQAVTDFLGSFSHKQNVVDLGCGDFNVGCQINAYVNKYIACDIVDDLIIRNKSIYLDDNIEFRVINIVDEDLPDGDIVFVRQVLQHLSNKDILKIIPKLYKYKFLVLTEHLPNDPDFIPNKDFISGPSIRLERNSGVVLTAPPFDLSFKSSKKICSVDESGGSIVTMVYELALN